MMTNYIPIDPGFGYTKCLVNNQQIKFANIIGNHRLSNNPNSKQRELAIKIDGLGAWNFGKSALLHSTAPSRGRMDGDRIFSNEFLANILLAISEGYSPNRREPIECSIITGLPGSEFNQYVNNAEYKARLKSHIIGKYQVERPDCKQEIIIKDAVCTNQQWGAIWRHLIDKNGHGIKPDTKANEVEIGSLNIGFNTIEAGTVLLGTSNFHIQTSGRKELSVNDGVHRLVKDVQVKLQQVYQKSFNQEQALTILENGGFILNGDWQEYELPEQAKGDFYESVYRRFLTTYGNDISFMYRLILTGGGANILKDSFDIPQMIVSDNPQWDNVEGYRRLIKSLRGT